MGKIKENFNKAVPYLRSVGFLIIGAELGFMAGQSKFTGDKHPPCFSPTIQEVGHFGIRAEQIGGVESPTQAGDHRVAGLQPELVGMLGGKGLKLVDITAHLEPFNGDAASSERNARLMGEAAELEGQLGTLVARSDFAHIGMHESYRSDASNAPITVAVSQPTC